MVLNGISEIAGRLTDTSRLPPAVESGPDVTDSHAGWTESGWQAICRAMYEDCARMCAPARQPPLAGVVAAAAAAVAGTGFGEYLGCLRAYLVTRGPVGEPRWRSTAVLFTGEAIPITAVSPQLWNVITGADAHFVAGFALTALRPSVGLVADLDVAHAAAGALLWQLISMSPGARLLPAPAASVADLIGVDQVFETPLPFLLAIGDHEESPT